MKGGKVREGRGRMEVGRQAGNIPKPKNAKARDHSSAGKGTDAFGVDIAKGGEDLIRVDSRLPQLVKRIGKNIQPVET